MSSHHKYTHTHSFFPVGAVTLRLLGAVIMLLTAAMLLRTKQRETLGFTLPSQQDAGSDGHPAERLGSPALSAQVHAEE